MILIYIKKAVKDHTCDLCKTILKKGELYANFRASYFQKGKYPIVKKYCTCHTIDHMLAVYKIKEPY